MEINLLSLEARGALYGLQIHYLYHGGLPTDERKLQVIAKVPPRKWPKIRDELREIFTHDWRHHRWDVALANVKDRRTKARAAGLASAEARRPSHETAPPVYDDAEEVPF